MGTDSDLSHIENGTPPNNNWSPMFIDREDLIEAEFVKESILFGTREEVIERTRKYIIQAAKDYIDGKNLDIYGGYNEGCDFTEIEKAEVIDFLKTEQITPRIRSWFVGGDACFKVAVYVAVIGEPQFSDASFGHSKQYWEDQYKSVFSTYNANPNWQGPMFTLELLLQMTAWDNTIFDWIVDEWGKTPSELDHDRLMARIDAKRKEEKN